MAKAQSINFTKDALEEIEAPAKGRVYIHDTKIPALGICVTEKGTKSFFVRATVQHKRKDGGIAPTTKRITLGRFPPMKVEQARTAAKKKLSDAVEGVDPTAVKRAQKATDAVTGLTVEQAVKLFGKNKVRRLSTGEKLPLKDSTIASYKASIKTLLGEDMYKGPLTDLTEDTITKRVHLGEKSGKTSTATGLRSLSAVWNWLARQKEYRHQLPANPVKQYSMYNEGLHVAAPKSTRIEREELPEWFDAIDDLHDMAGDFFYWLLFTGNRFSEAKGLQWEDIDWRRKVYQLRDPKNRRDVTLPLPSYVAERLKQRKQKEGPVFPFGGDARVQRKKACKAMGKHWTNHDLRRTFSGIAQAVCSYTSVKRLMNHAFTDITEQYIGHSADLGEEIDKVQREILRLAGRPLDNVVPLREVSA